MNQNRNLLPIEYAATQLLTLKTYIVLKFHAYLHYLHIVIC